MISVSVIAVVNLFPILPVWRRLARMLAWPFDTSSGLSA